MEANYCRRCGMGKSTDVDKVKSEVLSEEPRATAAVEERGSRRARTPPRSIT